MRAVRIAAWLAVLAGGVGALTAAGHGALAAPPLVHGVGAARAWATGRDAPTIFMSVLRVLALAGGWYLLAATVAGLLARATQVALLVRVTDALTLPVVRRLLGVGVLMVAAPGVLGAAAMGAPSPGAPPTLQRLPDAPPTLHRLSRPAAPNAGGAPEHNVPARPRPLATPPAPPDAPAPPEHDAPAAPSAAREHDAPAAPPAPPRPDAPAQPDPTRLAPAATWTVRPRDNLWDIARHTLALDFRPTDPDVWSYWRAVIAANPQLRDPSLIYPGDEITLPPAGSPPRSPAGGPPG